MPQVFLKVLLIVLPKGASVLLAAGLATMLSSCFSSRLVPRPGPGAEVGSKEFVAELGRVSDAPWQAGNEVKTLPNGASFFPRMLAAVKAAERTITLETFAFVDAPVSRDFARALAERAGSGVAVKVIFDNVGSAKAGEKNVKLMRAAGVEICFYHPINILRPRYSNNRTHRKILVVDGKVAFTGGAGFAHAWSGNAERKKKWRDTQYEIRGPAVARFQEAFRENWFELTGKELRGISYFPRLKAGGRDKVQVVFDDPWHPGTPIANGFVAAIKGARESLILQQSYFVPNRRFRELLLAAAARGVRVEVMVPDEGIDSEVTRHASQNHWAQLLRGGVRIFQYERTMIHGKLLVADGRFSIVGSANLDNRSFFINDEINLHVDSQEFAQEQLVMFRRDLKESREVTRENLRKFLAPGIKRFLARFVESQL